MEQVPMNDNLERKKTITFFYYLKKLNKINYVS